MAAAIALSERGVGQTGNNPPVGCIIVRDGRVVGRGWTQPGGRPHAEAMALSQAGDAARGATVYVSLEPCAHQSPRGPACADSIIDAAPARLVGALTDPDPRTAGMGFARIESAGIAVTRNVGATDARRILAGFLCRIVQSRPYITLKLASSLDGCIAMADGSSQWITGEAARAHAHIERTRCDAILVGGGTLRADNPTLDVRLPGLTSRSPRRILLSRAAAPSGWEGIACPEAIATLDCNTVLVEGGAQTASAFMCAGLVDRLLLYRAPILLGAGLPCLADIGLTTLADAHGCWTLIDTRRLGNDRLEVYEAVRKAPT
jgi:diaminohydroxyphosphoribosylaminopyrimidine deaminase / 5-amino-6-(5-phosphoribosylamino)uracil reductase